MNQTERNNSAAFPELRLDLSLSYMLRVRGRELEAFQGYACARKMLLIFLTTLNTRHTFVESTDTLFHSFDNELNLQQHFSSKC